MGVWHQSIQIGENQAGREGFIVVEVGYAQAYNLRIYRRYRIYYAAICQANSAKEAR